jgi:membrane-associated protein
LFAYTNPEVLNINHMIAALIVAAIAGDNTGYWFGRKTGPRLYARPDSRLFKKQHLVRAHEFYEKHGPKTIVLARFVPIIRTFGPIAAGIAEMPYRRFLPFSIGGGIAWITSMTLLGYYLGSSIPGVEKKIDKVILVVIAVSLLPMVIHFIQEKRHGKSTEEAAIGTVAPGLEGE